jgi:hypothetical protein
VAAASGSKGGSGGRSGGTGEQQQPVTGAAGAGIGAAAGAGPRPMSWLSSMTPIGSGGAALSSDTLADTLAKLMPQNTDYRAAVNSFQPWGSSACAPPPKLERRGR